MFLIVLITSIIYNALCEMFLIVLMTSIIYKALCEMFLIVFMTSIICDALYQMFLIVLITSIICNVLCQMFLIVLMTSIICDALYEMFLIVLMTSIICNALCQILGGQFTCPFLATCICITMTYCEPLQNALYHYYWSMVLMVCIYVRRPDIYSNRVCIWSTLVSSNCHIEDP